MKLLLRSGADPTLRNSQDKTPMDIAVDMHHEQCQELLENAANRQKHLFDNINIDWNLSHDDGSTDFSEDETIIDDRVSYKLVGVAQSTNDEYNVYRMDH